MHKKENIFFISNSGLGGKLLFKKTIFTRFFSLSRNWLKWATPEILTAGWDITGTLWAGIEVQTF
jgi:hypothetical protein